MSTTPNPKDNADVIDLRDEAPVIPGTSVDEFGRDIQFLEQQRRGRELPPIGAPEAEPVR